MLKYSLAVIVIGLLLAGCNNPTPPIEGRADPYAPPQIMFTDQDLSNKTAIDRPSLSRDPSGLLFVQVPIRSTTSKILIIQYRATFLDRNGQKIPGPEAWFRKDLAPNVREYITFNSINAQAADFQLDLRYAR